MDKVKLFVKKNAPTILTGLGAAGVVTTTVLAVKATPKALTLLEEAKEQKGEELTKTEAVMVAGKVYIPALLVGMGTLACIFAANALNKRQQAALMSAYALLDSSYKEYKAKVKELHGEEGHGEVVQGIATDKYEEDKFDVDDDKQLFFDEFSGRFFESTMDQVRNAEYQLNRELFMKSYATLNEWYDFLGMVPHEVGDMYGWTPEGNREKSWQEWIDFNHMKTLIDDDLECYIISFYQEPYLNFEDY